MSSPIEIVKYSDDDHKLVVTLSDKSKAHQGLTIEIENDAGQLMGTLFIGTVEFSAGEIKWGINGFNVHVISKKSLHTEVALGSDRPTPLILGISKGNSAVHNVLPEGASYSLIVEQGKTNGV